MLKRTNRPSILCTKRALSHLGYFLQFSRKIVPYWVLTSNQTCKTIKREKHEVAMCNQALNSYRRGLYNSTMFYLRMASWQAESIHVPFIIFIVEYWLLTHWHTEAVCLPTDPCVFGNPLLVPTERKEGVTKVQVMCCVRCAGHQRFFLYFGGLVVLVWPMGI